MIDNPGQWTDNLLLSYKRANEHNKNNSAPLVSKYKYIEESGEGEVFSLFTDAAFSMEKNIYAVGFHVTDPQNQSWGGGGHRINPGYHPKRKNSGY